MSLLVRPHTPPPGDDLDGLLRAFYKAELPDPWPSLEAPAARPAVLSPPSGRSLWSLFRHRWVALAASLAVLIAGALALPAGLSQPRNDAAVIPAPNPNGTSADKNLLPMPGSNPKFEESLEFDPVTGTVYRRVTVEPGR
jgi:hypothetical protein